MNDYFQTAVHHCIHATDGTVVKYIGDAIFAFWNAPDLQGDHSYRACEAALRFRDQPPQYMNGRELITRIGLAHRRGQCRQLRQHARGWITPPSAKTSISPRAWRG
jgi:class 3 adenylate cyclase